MKLLMSLTLGTCLLVGICKPGRAAAEVFTAAEFAQGCAFMTEALDSLDQPNAPKAGVIRTKDVIEQSMKGGLCLGFIQGFIGGFGYAHSPRSNTPGLCLPDEVTMAQIARMVVKENRENPELEHRPALELLVRTVRPFRCPK
jgi:hypothetical protein